MVVVDSSVAFKWIVNEEGSDRAETLLRREVLAAPDMILYEVSNVLHCQKRLPDARVQALLNTFLGFHVEIFALPSQKFGRVAELSRQFDITAYDASFIAMAELLKTELITADHKLLKKVHKLNYVRGL